MKSKGVPGQHRAPQPRGPVPGREVLTFGSENQQGFCLSMPVR